MAIYVGILENKLNFLAFTSYWFLDHYVKQLLIYGIGCTLLLAGKFDYNCLTKGKLFVLTSNDIYLVAIVSS